MNTVNVCGVALELRDFTNAEFLEYKGLLEHYGVDKIGEAYQQKKQRVDRKNTRPLAQAWEKKVKRLRKKHDALLEATEADDATDEQFEELLKVSDELVAAEEKLAELTAPLAEEAEASVTDLYAVLDEFHKALEQAQIAMCHALAVNAQQTDLTIDEFVARATPQDFDAAEQVCERGNALWAERIGKRLGIHQTGGPATKSKPTPPESAASASTN
jgi:hypothetical protein